MLFTKLVLLVSRGVPNRKTKLKMAPCEQIMELLVDQQCLPKYSINHVFLCVGISFKIAPHPGVEQWLNKDYGFRNYILHDIITQFASKKKQRKILARGK